MVIHLFLNAHSVHIQNKQSPEWFVAIHNIKLKVMRRWLSTSELKQSIRDFGSMATTMPSTHPN